MSTEDKELLSRRQSLSGSKRHVTRKTKLVEGFILSFKSLPNKFSMTELQSSLDNLKIQVKKTEEFADILVNTNGTLDDESQKVSDYLDEVYDSIQRLTIEVHSLINAQLSSNVQVQSQSPSQPIHQGPKIVESLRPNPKLSYDNNPVELNVFLNQFRRFYEASRLDKESILVQQSHLSCSMDSEVAGDLELHIMDTTPIFSDTADIKTCYSIIKEKWLQRYPLHKRRVQLIGSKRPDGMEVTAWINRIRMVANECSLKELNPDQITTLVICHGINDSLLQKELMLLKDKTKNPPGPPTLAQVVEYVENYEAADESTRPPNREMSRDIGNIGGWNRGSKPRHSPCRSCGDPNHVMEGCKYRKAVCYTCKEVGHMYKACWNNRRGSSESLNAGFDPGGH